MTKFNNTNKSMFFPVFGVVAMFVIPLHPIVHNLVLLFLMPTYRKAIKDRFCGQGKRGNAKKITPAHSLAATVPYESPHLKCLSKWNELLCCEKNRQQFITFLEEDIDRFLSLFSLVGPIVTRSTWKNDEMWCFQSWKNTWTHFGSVRSGNDKVNH